MNNFKPVAEQCDCEQQASMEQSGDEQPFHSNHFHINIDEFFVSAKQASPEHSVNICKIKPADFSFSLTDGFTDPLYAPPEA